MRRTRGLYWVHARSICLLSIGTSVLVTRWRDVRGDTDIPVMVFLARF